MVAKSHAGAQRVLNANFIEGVRVGEGWGWVKLRELRLHSCLNIGSGESYAWDMASASTQWKYLERDPKSSYKQLSIKGRRIRARTLYGLHVNAEEPMSIQEIAEGYNLPIEVVEEAIAYCRSKPPEIEEDFKREEMIAQLSGMNDPGYKFNPRPRPLTEEDRAAIRRAFPR